MNSLMPLAIVNMESPGRRRHVIILVGCQDNNIRWETVVGGLKSLQVFTFSHTTEYFKYF